jgi:hypothetical protein
MHSFPGGQNQREAMVRFGADIPAGPAPLRRSLSPVETANLESLIVALLEGQRTAGLYVGSFKLVLGCLCHFPESAIERTSRHFPFVSVAAISSLARRRRLK